MASLQSWWVNAAYNGHPLLNLLRPVAWVYQQVSAVRRRVLFQRQQPYSVPVVVVGNITLGGAGKTPLVIHLVELLQSKGYKPGVVSRGYGGSASSYPRQLNERSQAASVGDEPMVIFQRTGCPIVVDPDRDRAVKTLLKSNQVDVVISDDGLQHYAMHRDIEIAVLDGKRRLGNKLCLPAGPLREAPSRLNEVDFVVFNGRSLKSGDYHFTLKPQRLINVNDAAETQELSHFLKTQVHAVAGIAHPQRFFNCLTKAGLDVIPHAFPDHYVYAPEDFNFADSAPVIMTEKDYVKCSSFSDKDWWYLSVDAVFEDSFDQSFLERLHTLMESTDRNQ